MKHLTHLAALCACLTSFPVSAHVQEVMNEPDSVYLFSYATVNDAGRSGLKLAWSTDEARWFSIGNGYGYVKCDYGAWGAEKRMFNPHLVRDEKGVWHCFWQLNESGKEWGHATSPDLMKWNPQTYYMQPARDGEQVPTVKRGSETRKKAVVEGVLEQGYVQKVAWEDVDRLLKFVDYRAYRDQLHNERTEQDAQRFAGLAPVSLQLTVRPEEAKPISDKLIGIFFEDINYGADGGLYAELVQNRDFEYSPKDNAHQGFDSGYAWSVWENGQSAAVKVSTENPLHENNPHYVVLQAKPGMALRNPGFDGITLKKGEKYDFSVFSRMPEGSKGGKVIVRLLDNEGKEVAKSSVRVAAGKWKKQSAVLTTQTDVDAAVLSVEPEVTGELHLDMVSLFPQKTFKDRKNGLRADLAQTLADLHPRFVRFPGGCVAHGNGIDNIYRWKNSVGPLEARKPMGNLWGYHQTLGLGYFEYFQFCEDIGAEPLPVLAAGVPCQNSACIPGKPLSGGQQGGIPMEEMGAYVQDILDLIEYANGDPKKSKWAKMRAEAGHPEPFNLKYVGIGNEDLITPVFEERFEMIFKAVKEKYPEITVIGTVGPFYEGTDYEAGWKFATRLNVPMVDEHYYMAPDWFFANAARYDDYDRKGPKVFAGEYASHDHPTGKANNFLAALSEAAFMTGLERNADVVRLATYAPLFAHVDAWQWNPDLIWFDNLRMMRTPNYYVQQMYGMNAGTDVLNLQMDGKPVTGQDSLYASAVLDAPTGEVILKLVNAGSRSEKVQIEFSGLKKRQLVSGSCTYLQSDDWKAKNTLEQEAIVPRIRPVEVASRSLSLELQPRSFGVYRLRISTQSK